MCFPKSNSNAQATIRSFWQGGRSRKFWQTGLFENAKNRLKREKAEKEAALAAAALAEKSSSQGPEESENADNDKSGLGDKDSHQWDVERTRSSREKCPDSVFWDSNLEKVFSGNRQWAEQMLKEDPDFFKSMQAGQSPSILYIGCADSRLPANEILNLGAGAVFVHRNIANMVLF